MDVNVLNSLWAIFIGLLGVLIFNHQKGNLLLFFQHRVHNNKTCLTTLMTASPVTEQIVSFNADSFQISSCR